PGSDRAAGARGIVVQRDQRGDGRACRHGDVAARACPQAAAESVDMTHPDFEAQVDLYLDGELAPSDARELEVHLVQCAECTRFRDKRLALRDRKSTRLNSSHVAISYAVFCLKKKKTEHHEADDTATVHEQIREVNGFL